MVCADCGVSNSPQARFCGNCGAPLSAPCPACGAAVARSSRFCKSCGADFGAGHLHAKSDNRETIAAPVNPPQHLAKRILESRAAIEGERKQVTVLFADMKGSTNLIQDLDPEQVEERLRPTIQIMIDAVHRYEGTVNRIEGDGIMALFGAPLAYEDSAVRAAYAALDMQNALRAPSNGEPVIRVGLHAGEVLVRAVNTDLSVDYDAIGATVHLAARMEQMATPGSIYCTSNIARLAEGLIEARSLGPTPVKGFRDPLDLFEITGHTSARTRWEASAIRGLTRFVSRDAEIELLSEAMAAAVKGHGKLVGVVGEPGAGKSRFVHEMLHTPAASTWTILRTTNASYTRNTPYLAFSNLIRTWCEIPEEANPDDIERRVRAKLSALGADLVSALPAILSLLDIPVKDTEWQSLEPTARRHRILTAAKNMVLRAASAHPLLLWVEDMQWTDAETRALLDEIANAIDTIPLLIILTYRPEYEHKWAGKDFYRTIEIKAFHQDAADEMVRNLLGDDESNSPLCELVVRRTDGIPLFIEETIRSLVEKNILSGHIGDYKLCGNIDDIRIPESIQAVLASRIDRLTSEQRSLLQTASVIGADVQVTLLEKIVDIDRDELRTLLADLHAADFLYQIPDTSSFQFRFKHALTHEVAYGSLLSKTRRELHGRIVNALESQYRGNLAEMAESLAHHALAGELWEEALGYARQAGGKALELSAFREARIFFERALLALTHLPQDHAHVQAGLDIRLGLRMIFGATTDYVALEACLREAEALAISIEDRPRLAAISIAQTFVHNWQGDLEAGARYGERGLGIAREIGDSRLTLSASSFLAQAYMWRGDFRKALALLRDNQSWTTGPLRLERIGTTGTSSVLWLGMLAASGAYLGDFEEAEGTAQQACATANETGRPYDIALAHWYAGFVQAHRGNPSRALTLLEHGYHTCRAARISFLIPVISTSLGHAYTLAGRYDEGTELLAKAIDYSRAAKFPYGVAWSTVYLGFANLTAGRMQGVAEQAGTAIDLARRHLYRGVEASARRLMGEACQRGNRRRSAEIYCLEALQIASELGLRPEMAHCQNDLAHICFLLGRLDDGDRYRNAATALYSNLGMPASVADSRI
ncbi:AAA family ATPase [Afipia sp. TerB]